MANFTTLSQKWNWNLLMTSKVLHFWNRYFKLSLACNFVICSVISLDDLVCLHFVLTIVLDEDFFIRVREESYFVHEKSNTSERGKMVKSRWIRFLRLFHPTESHFSSKSDLEKNKQNKRKEKLWKRYKRAYLAFFWYFVSLENKF